MKVLRILLAAVALVGMAIAQSSSGGQGGVIPGAPCGDSTHALNWSGSAYGCQAITATAAAGGANTQLQWNNATALGGISGWTTNGTTTINGAASSVFDMHLGSSLFLPGGLSTGLVRVTTSTGAISGAELSGDVSTSGSNAATVLGINGTLLSGLASGFLKVTTGTGVPSSIPDPLGSTHGGTGVNNTATLTLGSSNINFATLGTGIVKNTVTTGALTDAASSDIIGLFTACSGTQYLGADGACHTPTSGLVTTQGYANPGNAAGNGITPSPSTLDATVFSGADTCAKIKATIETSVSGNGAATADARGFESSTPITCAAAPMASSFPGDSGVMLLPSANFNAQTPWILAQSFSLIGTGPGVCANGGNASFGTCIAMFNGFTTATTTPVAQLQFGSGTLQLRTSVENLAIHGNALPGTIGIINDYQQEDSYIRKVRVADFTVAGMDTGNGGGNAQHGPGVQESEFEYSAVLGIAAGVPGLNTSAYTVLTTYNQGQIILPVTNNAGGYTYVDITSGNHSTGASAPAFCQTPPTGGALGCTTVDSGVTWQNVGYALNGYTFGSATASETSNTVTITFPSQGSVAANVALQNVSTRYQVSVSSCNVPQYNGTWYVNSVPTPYVNSSTTVAISTANFPTTGLSTSTASCNVIFYPVGIRAYQGLNSYLHPLENTTITATNTSASGVLTNFALCGLDISGGVGYGAYFVHTEGYQYGACIGLYRATSGVTLDNFQTESNTINGVLISNQQGSSPCGVTNLAIRNFSARGAGGTNPTNSIVDQCNSNTITFANNPDVAQYNLDGKGFPHAILKNCADMTNGWCDDGTNLVLYASNAAIFTISDSSGLVSVGSLTATGTVNFRSAAHTGSVQTGLIASIPATCTPGDLYFATDQTHGQSLNECYSGNTWVQQLNSGASGANQALSNLSGVAVNASLVPGSDNSLDLGGVSLRWRNAYIGTNALWTNGSGSADTGICRGAAGQLDISNGGACAATGTLFAAGFASGTATVPATGEISLPGSIPPSAPASGTLIWFDSTDLRLHEVGNAGTVGTTVVAIANTSHKWINSLGVNGVFTETQPAISDLTASFTSPLSLSTNTLSCPTCATTTNGGALMATSPVTISAAGLIAISGVTGEQGNGALLQLSTGTVNLNRITKFDTNGNTINSNLLEASSLLSNAANTATTYSGALDASANAAQAATTFRGGDQTGAGGASSTGGGVIVRGGNNAATNAASQAGGIELLAGASTGATQGLQGPFIAGINYVKGGGTSTLWNLQCGTGVAMTVNDCGASPNNVLGVAEAVNSNTVVTLFGEGQAFVNASAAVTLNHTVCASGTAGKVTDSGGTATCTNAQGETIGIVIATSGAWTLPDGVTATASTTLPLIQFAPGVTIPTTAGSPSLDQVTGSASQVTRSEVGAGDNVTLNGVETASLTTYITIQDTNSTNSNTSVGLIANCAGTSTGCIGLIGNSVSGTGDLFRLYSGSTITNGTLSGGTKEFSVAASGAVSVNATTNQLLTGTGANITTSSYPASSGAVTLTFPITTELMLGANSDTTTTHVAHSTAVAGVVNMTAITTGDLPTSGIPNVVYNNTTNAGTSAMTLDMHAATTASSVQLPNVVGGTILAGTSTASLSAPIVFSNTNSSNNNTSITMGVTAPGTSTGQTVLNVNGATTGGDLVDFGTGGTWTAGVLSGQTIVDAFTPTGILKLGSTPPTVTTPGTGFIIAGTEGTEPGSLSAAGDAIVADSANHCLNFWTNATNVGCGLAETTVLGAGVIPKANGTAGRLAASLLSDNATTLAYTGPAGMTINTIQVVVATGSPVIQTPLNAIGIFNPTALPATFANATQSLAVGTQYGPPGIIDKSIGVTTVAMGAQTSATCTNVTGMSWPLAANKNYLLRCEVPMTLATTATIQYCLGGPGTATSYSLIAEGDLGTGGIWSQISTLAQTAYGTKTGASASVAATSVQHVWAQIQNGSTASGIPLTLQTAANGTNAITVLANASCTLTQEN